jgi:hypothetical protein
MITFGCAMHKLNSLEKLAVVLLLALPFPGRFIGVALTLVGAYTRAKRERSE